MNSPLILRYLALALIVTMSGCVYSTRPVVISGQKYNRDAIAFLDLPGITRQEVIATFGPPNYDLKDSHTMVYVWATSYDLKMVHPANIGKLDIGSEPVHLGSVDTEWGLFIVLNESGVVASHSIGATDTSALQKLTATHTAPTDIKQ